MGVAFGLAAGFVFQGKALAQQDGAHLACRRVEPGQRAAEAILAAVAVLVSALDVHGAKLQQLGQARLGPQPRDQLALAGRAGGFRRVDIQQPDLLGL